MAASTAVKVVLLDIEGTVCPISFVKDVLFPYALRVLPETAETQWDSPEFKKYRDAFPAEYSSSKEALEAHAIDLIVRDVKIAYLKSLQGYLWEEGYKSGDLKAPLFKDVPLKLSRWHGQGLKVMIYSSGSVPAQKLLFKHTTAEPSDLTFLISDWFDTVNAGLKTEVSSYETIASKHPEYLPAQWLFLSDNVKEVDAAIAAGFQSVVVQRPGNAELPAEVYDRLQVVETFDAFDQDFKVETQQTLGKRDRNSAKEDEPTVTSSTQDSHTAKKLRVGEDQSDGAVSSKEAETATERETGDDVTEAHSTSADGTKEDDPANGTDASNQK